MDKRRISALDFRCRRDGHRILQSRRFSELTFSASLEPEPFQRRLVRGAMCSICTLTSRRRWKGLSLRIKHFDKGEKYEWIKANCSRIAAQTRLTAMHCGSSPLP